MLNRLQDVFKSLQKHNVKYVVIGGIASILYGVPRATFDLDILIEATPQNGLKLLEALTDAGLGTATLTTSMIFSPMTLQYFKTKSELMYKHQLQV